MSYITIEPQMDDVALAHAVKNATKASHQDATVKPVGIAFLDRLAKAGLHPAWQKLDREKWWRAFGYHIAKDAALNTLKMPFHEFGLNSVAYPTLQVQYYLQQDGQTLVMRRLDKYPDHANLIFPGCLMDEEISHPFLKVPSEEAKDGDGIYPCVAQFGHEELDGPMRMPFKLFSLSRKWAEYRLDVEAATVERYPFRRLAGMANIKLFERYEPEISRFLKRDVAFEPNPNDDAEIFLIDTAAAKAMYQVVLPSSFMFNESMLQDGEVYFGKDVATGADISHDLATLPHLLIAGQSGSGKSVLLNSIMRQFVWNASAFEELVACDFKGGVELADYADACTKVTLVDRYDDMPPVVDRVLATVDARLTRMRAKREKLSSERIVALIIDEYAMLAVQAFADREAKQRHDQTMSNLNNISMRGRAAQVKIIACLQQATTTNMASAFRNNLQGRMLGRVYEKQTVANVFGDAQDLEGKPADFPKGCFFTDLANGYRGLVQVPFVSEQAPIATRERSEQPN